MNKVKSGFGREKKPLSMFIPSPGLWGKKSLTDRLTVVLVTKHFTFEKFWYLDTFWCPYKNTMFANKRLNSISVCALLKQASSSGLGKCRLVPCQYFQNLRV
jgi:hypothetical protein